MAKLDLLPAFAQKIEFNVHKNRPRPYIGYSSLGRPCQRANWLDFHWVMDREHSARIDRLFARGKYEEEVVVRDLRSVGCVVTDQEKEVVGIEHYVMGHIDGLVTNVPGCEKTTYLLEIKTMNDRNFKLYQRDGLKRFNPAYWQQIHSYMGHLGLKKCLYIVTNKNNEQRDYQKIEYDAQQFGDGERIAYDLLTSEYPPEKFGGRTFYLCKFCHLSPICYEGADILWNCRTCAKVDITDNGWQCSVSSKMLTVEAQARGCHRYNRSKAFD